VAGVVFACPKQNACKRFRISVHSHLLHFSGVYVHLPLPEKFCFIVPNRISGFVHEMSLRPDHSCSPLARLVPMSHAVTIHTEPQTNAF